MDARFSQRVARLSDFQSHAIRRSGNRRLAIVGFTVDGQLTLPTRSFWQWLFAQFSKVTRIEEEAEFFDRLRSEMPNARVHYGLVWHDDGDVLLTAPQLPRKRESGNKLSRTRQTLREKALFMDLDHPRIGARPASSASMCSRTPFDAVKAGLRLHL